MKKFIGLSNGSLTIVNNWLDGNADTPIGKAYKDAATARRNFSHASVLQQIEQCASSPIKARNDLKRLKILSYQYRDGVGRVILDMIKRGEGVKT